VWLNEDAEVQLGDMSMNMMLLTSREYPSSGYVDPAGLLTGSFSTASDIYSIGTY
jgi:hypothetical protein